MDKKIQKQAKRLKKSYLAEFDISDRGGLDVLDQAMESYSRMREAQQVRLGWASARTGLASGRLLGGSLFLRVYDRGLRSSEAMRCRGSGTVVTGVLPRPCRSDIVAGLGAASFIIILGLLALGVES